MKLSLAFFLSLAFVVACKKPAPAPAAAPEVSDAGVTSAALASKEARPTTTSEVRKEAVLVWRATPSGNQKVNVTLQVDRETFALGTLDATTTGAESGTSAACSVRREGTSKTKSTFTCGGTPAFNFLTAELRDGSLVVTRTTGVEDGETTTNVKKVELRREPSSAAALAVRPFAKTAPVKTKAPACAGANEQMIDGACRRKCDADADCTNGEACLPVHDFSGGKLGPVLGTFCE